MSLQVHVCMFRIRVRWDSSANCRNQYEANNILHKHSLQLLSPFIILSDSHPLLLNSKPQYPGLHLMGKRLPYPKGIYNDITKHYPANLQFSAEELCLFVGFLWSFETQERQTQPKTGKFYIWKKIMTQYCFSNFLKWHQCIDKSHFLPIILRNTLI